MERSFYSAAVTWYKYIAGNFRGVKYSFLSWPRPHKNLYRNAPNTVHVVKQTKILLTKLTAVQVQRNFYPTKITRYTVLRTEFHINFDAGNNHNNLYLIKRDANANTAVSGMMYQKGFLINRRLPGYRTMWKDWPGETPWKQEIRREHRHSHVNFTILNPLHTYLGDGKLILCNLSECYEFQLNVNCDANVVYQYYTVHVLTSTSHILHWSNIMQQVEVHDVVTDWTSHRISCFHALYGIFSGQS